MLWKVSRASFKNSDQIKWEENPTTLNFILGCVASQIIGNKTFILVLKGLNENGYIYAHGIVKQAFYLVHILTLGTGCDNDVKENLALSKCLKIWEGMICNMQYVDN